VFHIVLFQPEIPPNTGNAIRLCANTGSTLHLVKPLGFDLHNKNARRAGLDYKDLATVQVHQGMEDCLQALAGARLFAVETTGTRPYSEAEFQPGDALIFGSERRGLPPRVLETIPPERQLTIPMRARYRRNRATQRYISNTAIANTTGPSTIAGPSANLSPTNPIG
jgi:tRNA (cytidine/uridine-2'-O-)-methyltransferase